MNGSLESRISSWRVGDRGPSGVAHGMPGYAYNSPDFMAFENERLFPRTWVFVGFAHEIAEVGDAFPAFVGGQPILVIRSSPTEVKAFHNVCRHRGVRLIEEPAKRLARITCPYHAWSYGVDGRLRTTPHFGGFRKDVESFRKEEHGLAPVRCERWLDWIFVNLDGNCPPLEDYVRPMVEVVGNVPLHEARPAGRIELGTVKANWKYLMENFIEPYHVPIVHSKTAAGQPLKDHYNIVNGACIGSAVDLQESVPGLPRGEQLDMSARYLTLFPNFVLGIYLPDQIGVHLNVPVSSTETRQSRVIYSLGKDLSETEIQGLKELWYSVHKEDHAVVERMQAASTSRVMEAGQNLSPHWETSLQAFQERVWSHLS